ncbi:MAG: AGE family epimerase/isomerase [Saprospiraceae bacterium]|nr:AGE family epimerase/isomerase [Saprospiraceae bacterium]
MDFDYYKTLYQTALLDDVMPFWLTHSRDATGGYFTSLLSDGRVYDTDKFIWLQARQVYIFALMYNQVEALEEWLNFALHGADFLLQHGRDSSGRWYFSVDRNGNPLVQPYNIFSDCFACLAFGQLFKATGDQTHAQIARETFSIIELHKENPKGKYEKRLASSRPLKDFALPMILCNLCLENTHLFGAALVDRYITRCISEVMSEFYDPVTGYTHEYVLADGDFSDSFEGRLLNPGHAIEAMWFVMDLGVHLGDRHLVDAATSRTLSILNQGWDQKYGGIFYFLDSAGHPPVQLEWDQKLWWVHLEALVALSKGYLLTENRDCLHWFDVVHTYTWSNFPDPVHGEWWGYLNRRGEVLLPLKGGKWKGCFHVPRALLQCWKTLETLSRKSI